MSYQLYCQYHLEHMVQYQWYCGIDQAVAKYTLTSHIDITNYSILTRFNN